MGPVIIAENVGAIRSVDSREESGSCGDAGGVANAPDDVGPSRACSNVASATTPAALLEAIDAAIAALDAGETDDARHGCTGWRKRSGPTLPVKLLWRRLGYPPDTLAGDRTLDGSAAVERHSVRLLAPFGALDPRRELPAAASILLESDQHHALRGCLLGLLPDSDDPPMRLTGDGLEGHRVEANALGVGEAMGRRYSANATLFEGGVVVRERPEDSLNGLEDEWTIVNAARGRS